MSDTITKGRMTEGSATKLILSFSIPLLLGNVLQQLYNMVDSIVVGNYVGKVALAAVGTGFPIVFMLVALFMGLANGASIMVSQYFGAKEYQKVSDTVDTFYTAGIIASLPLTIIGILISGPMLRLMNTPEDTYHDAWVYMVIIFIGILFMIGYNLNSGLMQAMGDSKTPVILLSISCVLNIVLDLLFVIVFHWDVAGVAIATILAQAVSWIAGIILINRKYEHIQIKPFKFFFDKSLFKQVIRLGVPSGLNQMLFSIGIMAMQSLVNGYGSDFMAGFNGANKLDMFAFMPTQSFASALTVFVGQNVGAGKMHRVKDGLRSTLIMSLASGVLAMFVVLTWGENMMMLFSREPEVIAAGMEYLRPVMYCYLLFAVMNAFMSVIRGAGEMIVPMITSIFSLWLIRIPLAYLLAHFLGREYIFYCYGGGWLLGMIISVAYYATGRWKNKAVVSKQKQEELALEEQIESTTLPENE